MKIQVRKAIIVCLLFCGYGISSADEKKVIGWVEPISIDNGAFTFFAKIDTGADGLSINAENVDQYQKDGKRWVSFTIVNGKGIKHTISRPIHSYIRVKRKGLESQRRPVILMDICLGRHHSEERVNLVDRGNFKYQGLVGRRFLKGNFLVDSETVKTTKPACDFK